MNLVITPTAEEHFSGLYRAIDTVARERRYFGFLQAPPLEQSFAFYRNIVENDLCQFVALSDGVVVGWCDILPAFGDAMAHVGILGMGVTPLFRCQGIGKRLIETTLAKARSKEFTRIELRVRTDNDPARILYEQHGFSIEGTLYRSLRVDGCYFDAYLMALLL